MHINQFTYSNNVCMDRDSIESTEASRTVVAGSPSSLRSATQVPGSCQLTNARRITNAGKQVALLMLEVPSGIIPEWPNASRRINRSTSAR